MTESKHTPAENIQRYLNMRRLKPMPQLGDVIHAVNIGSEFEGELLLSDLKSFWVQFLRMRKSLEDLYEFAQEHYAPYHDSEAQMMFRARAAIKEARGE